MSGWNRITKLISDPLFTSKRIRLVNPIMTRVMVVDDHSMIRKTLKILLSKVGAFDIVGEVGTGEEARRVFAESHPTFLILDVALPDCDGLSLVKEFTDQRPDTNILVYSGAIGRDLAACCLGAGARGFIEKTKPLEDLLEAIECVAVLNKPYFGDGQHPLFNPGEVILTQRESQVATLIARSFSNKQIAQELNLSVNTVEVHRNNLMKKLGVHDAAAITRYAIQRGLISIR
jgi:DNA-binding NarL/FixJ family response regulator